ncbi:hypothetical protein FPV67DRAFT_1667347 [Lyophyllum atratum]|nr:hypothetical protein FPV67DRAFT_1667347 [Lyophyllum atratum]
MLETTGSDVPNVSEIAVFDAFALTGFLLNAAVLVPVFFSPSVRRRTAWSGLIVSFLIYSFSYLAMAGWQMESKRPPFGLCFFQAALIYASPTLVGISYICFTLDFALQLSTVVFGRGKSQSSAWRTKILIILPWLCFFGVFVTVFMVVGDPSMIEPSAGRFYCHATTRMLAAINVVAAVLAAVILFPVDFYMAYILYRNWGAFRRLSTDNSGVSLSMYIRLTLFLLLGGIGIGLSAAFIPSIGHSSAPRSWNVLLPIIPIVGAITLGTGKDIMMFWVFWKKPNVRPPVPTKGTPEASLDRMVIAPV